MGWYFETATGRLLPDICMDCGKMLKNRKVHGSGDGDGKLYHLDCWQKKEAAKEAALERARIIEADPSVLDQERRALCRIG